MFLSEALSLGLVFKFCVCVYVYFHVCAHGCACVWSQRLMSAIVHFCSPPYILRQGLLLNLELTNLLGWLSIKP